MWRGNNWNSKKKWNKDATEIINQVARRKNMSSIELARNNVKKKDGG